MRALLLTQGAKRRYLNKQRAKLYDTLMSLKLKSYDKPKNIRQYIEKYNKAISNFEEKCRRDLHLSEESIHTEVQDIKQRIIDGEKLMQHSVKKS